MIFFIIHIGHHSAEAIPHGFHIPGQPAASVHKTPGCDYAHGDAPAHGESNNQSVPAAGESAASERGSFLFQYKIPSENRDRRSQWIPVQGLPDPATTAHAGGSSLRLSLYTSQ